MDLRHCGHCSIMFLITEKTTAKSLCFMAVKNQKNYFSLMNSLRLAKRDDVEFKPTVNWCPENEAWEGSIGVITTLIPQVKFDPQKTYAIICGPPVMYKFVIADLKSRNVPDDHIIISLERRMKCGVGKCGHCQINQVYVCKDGPVFNYSKIKGIPEAL